MIFGRFDYAIFLSFFAYAAGSTIFPLVLPNMARELGFSLTEGGMAAGGALHFGRTIPQVLTMVLCGFANGAWGMRRTLGTSVLLMGTGVLICAFAPVYAVLFLSLMVAGLGEGVVEGLATPFVQDLHPEEPGRYINFSHSFWCVGIVVTTTICGYLLWQGVSWRWLVGSVAAIALIPALLLLLPPPKGHRHAGRHEPVHWAVVWRNAASILKMRRFWVFFAAMFVAGGGEFGITYWTASYIQLNLDAAAWASGVGIACFAGGMFIGRTGWAYLLRQHHLKGLIISSALAATAITFLFPFIQNIWAVFAMLLITGLAVAPFWPSVQSFAADCLPEADTTMLFIMLSCAGIPGCSVVTWLMGRVGDLSGGNLRPAFYIVTACFLLLALLVAVSRAKVRNQKPAIATTP